MLRKNHVKPYFKTPKKSFSESIFLCYCPKMHMKYGPVQMIERTTLGYSPYKTSHRKHFYYATSVSNLSIEP